MQANDLVRRAYFWACERLYHEFAWSYNAVSRLVSLGAWPQWRRLALAELPGPRVLELGFGTGELLAEVAARYPLVVGLELSPAMHAVAARRMGGRGMDGRGMDGRGMDGRGMDGRGVTPARLRAYAQAMPLAAGSFDGVLSTFPAPYILEPATLGECARVLRPGGKLVVGGLWVRLRRPGVLSLLPVFYADPTPAQVEAITQRVAAAGFAVTWPVYAAGSAELPLLVAERLPTPAAA